MWVKSQNWINIWQQQNIIKYYGIIKSTWIYNYTVGWQTQLKSGNSLFSAALLLSQSQLYGRLLSRTLRISVTLKIQNGSSVWTGFEAQVTVHLHRAPRELVEGPRAAQLQRGVIKELIPQVIPQGWHWIGGSSSSRRFRLRLSIITLEGKQLSSQLQSDQSSSSSSSSVSQPGSWVVVEVEVLLITLPGILAPSAFVFRRQIRGLML